jgi:hypothetical protein
MRSSSRRLRYVQRQGRPGQASVWPSTKARLSRRHSGKLYAVAHSNVRASPFADATSGDCQVDGPWPERPVCAKLARCHPSLPPAVARALWCCSESRVLIRRSRWSGADGDGGTPVPGPAAAARRLAASPPAAVKAVRRARETGSAASRAPPRRGASAGATTNSATSSASAPPRRHVPASRRRLLHARRAAMALAILEAAQDELGPHPAPAGLARALTSP